jgi:uncharacterized protein YmfQ (DUF2313 family)
MSVASATAATYAALLEKLLPPGVYFRVEPESRWANLLTGLAGEMSRAHNVVVEWLLVQCYPDTATGSSSVDGVNYGGMLAEWLETLGLPECGIELGTEEAQQAAAAAKFKATCEGGQSASYLEGVAADAGYTITIESGNDGPHPFRVGTSPVDAPLRGQEWAFAFIVNALLTDATYFRTGTSGVDEPLVDWAGDIIECLINKLKPTESIPHFVYS